MLETDIIDSAVKRGLALDFILDKQSATLGHNFTLYDTGNNRIAREMSPAEELVFTNPVFSMTYTVLVNIDLIDKKHRLAVRKILFQFFSFHFMCAVL